MVSEAGVISNFQECMSVMQSGSWVANPNIAKLNFTTPRRDKATDH